MFAIPSAPSRQAKKLDTDRKINVFIDNADTSFSKFGLQSQSSSDRHPSARYRQPRSPHRFPLPPSRYRYLHGISTGASLMPSPTNASVSFFAFLQASSSSTLGDTLSAGSSSLCTSSMPSSAATCICHLLHISGQHNSTG